MRVLTGPRAVTEALRSRRGEVAVVYVAGRDRGGVREVVQLARQRGVKVERRDAAELDELAGGLRHQNVVAMAGQYPYLTLDRLLSTRPRTLLAVDEVTDPHNLGAVLRTAVAFGVDGIVLPRHRTASVTPAVVRVSAGATEHARIAQVVNLGRALDALRKRGMQVVGLAGEGETTLRALRPAPRGRVLVLGSEGRGLRPSIRQRCDVLARIDLPGPIESLNASVAAGIAIYEATRVEEAHGQADDDPPEAEG